MKGSVALSVGAAALLAAGVLLGPAARAGERDEGEKKVQRHVVIRHGGGGHLGVVLGDLDGDARGARVRSVESGSAAEKAGLKQDDVITRFDGEAVRSAGQLARLVRETPAGRPVAIEVMRAGATQKLSATVAETVPRSLDEGPAGPGEFQFELPELPPSAHGTPMPPDLRGHVWRFGRGAGPMFHLGSGQPRRLGVEFIELGEQLAAYFKVGDGVLVTSVEADSAAAKAGVKAGDVVVEFDGHRIKDGGDLRDAVAEGDGGKELLLKLQREGRPLELKVVLAKPEATPSRESGVTL